MNNHLSLHNSAYYSIQLAGLLDQGWAEHYGDLQVQTTVLPEQRRTPVTTITGEVRDQAALAGLLNLVSTLGMGLLSVNYLGQPPAAQDPRSERTPIRSPQPPPNGGGQERR